MGKKDKHTDEASAAPSSRLTPMEIQQKEFRVSRFGGYKMRDVDEFLDQITDTFSAMSAEIERLRAGGAAPVVGSPDLDDVSRQADEIIARARAEATRITAEARAAASGGAGGGSAERSAVNAFIVREREFLQSLASLVQERNALQADLKKETEAQSLAESEMQQALQREQDQSKTARQELAKLQEEYRALQAARNQDRAASASNASDLDMRLRRVFDEFHPRS